MLPATLFWIKDAEAWEFIGKCLANAANKRTNIFYYSIFRTPSGLVIRNNSVFWFINKLMYLVYNIKQLYQMFNELKK